MISAKEFSKEISVVQTPEKTFVIAVAIAKEKEKNSVTKISCDIGSPLSGYVYDAQSDSYNIFCNSYVKLGVVPISLKIIMNNHNHWFCRIPLPYKILIKKLSINQKKDLAKFAAQFSDKDFTIDFIQAIL